MVRHLPCVPFVNASERLDLNAPQRLTPEQLELAARLLEPRVKVALHGELRQFAGLINLERVLPPGQPSTMAGAFHRLYRG